MGLTVLPLFSLGGSNMDCTMVFGHNIFIDDKLVGYIGSNHDGSATLFLGGKKFADFSSEGSIDVDGKKMGHITDEGDVLLHNIVVGEIDSSNDIRFSSQELAKAIKG